MNAWGIALQSIWHHKLRSGLTALGVVIGVFAVVTLAALGGGVKSYVTGQFDGSGATLIAVTPAAPGTQQRVAAASSGTRPARGSGLGAGGGFGATPSTLTIADAQAIAGLSAAGITGAAPVAEAAAPVAAPGGSPQAAVVVGTTAPYFSIQGLHFAAGSAGGITGGVVLGSKAEADLFGAGTPPGSAVGQDVQVGGKSLPVVGVLRSAGAQIGAEPDTSVFVPVATALAMSNSQHVSEIVADAAGTAQVAAAASAVQRLMDQRHPLQDFAVVTATQMLAIVTRTLSVITSVLSGIAAISLIVGGIGIMNIMLVTVAERVREIGTRKALGARDGDILVQFLVESILLAVLGGALGTAASALADRVVGHLIHVPLGLTGHSVVLALSFSIGVGALFGVLPAMNASRLMPAEALRSE